MLLHQFPILDDESEWPTESTGAWRGFCGGLINWYLFGKVVWILNDETRYLARSTSGHVHCGTCLSEASSDVFFWSPIYLLAGVILWKWVATVAPSWRLWAMWPVRFGIVIWCGVFGTLILLPFIPDWK